MKIETISDHQPVFTSSTVATHMPFFDGSTLLFCQAGQPIERELINQGSIHKNLLRNPVLAERLKNLTRNQKINYRAWKLAFCNWEDRAIHPITTGLPANGIECSPAFYRDGGQVHLSFIGGVPSDRGFTYSLYSSSGSDLEHLEPAKPILRRTAFFGFISLDHICWGLRNKLTLTEKASGKVFQLKTNFIRIFRVTFVADNAGKLLITGSNDKHQYKTVLHDLETKNTSEVSAGGSVYKSSLNADCLVHAKQRKNGFEDRELYHGSYTLTPTAIQIFNGD